jgi:uncharacterized oligopeptide transporter (OPT) family protein
MARPRDRDKPLALVLIKRAAILLLVVCLVSLFYWVVGSTSSFLDSTQSMLLGIMRISSMGILIAAALGILLGLALARVYPIAAVGILGYLFLVALASVLLALAQTVSFLSRGLH